MKRLRELPKCPRCRRQCVSPNGRKSTCGEGRLQQIRCEHCGHQWLNSDGLKITRSLRRPRFSERKLIFALLALCAGLTLTEISKLVGIKAATLATRIEDILRNNPWSYLEALIAAEFEIADSGFLEFADEIQASQTQSEVGSLFRKWGQNLRRRDKVERSAALKRASIICQRSLKQN